MKNIKFYSSLLTAALLVALMAAMHGLIGESAFKIFSGTDYPALVLGLALPALAILAFAFWQRENVMYFVQKRLNLSVGEAPHATALGPLTFAIILFASMSLAQGVLALSAAHLAAHYSHHSYGWMLGVGFVVFLLGTLLLWKMRDSLFHVDAKAEEIKHLDWPFHVAVVSLSTPGRGQPVDIEKDKKVFALAYSDFDSLLEMQNWEDAVKALIVERAFGDVAQWNFQQTLRLLETMANSKWMPNKRRAMIFVTTKESDERWERAKALLTKIAESMPKDKGPQIEIRCLGDLGLLLRKHPEKASRQFDKFNFNKMFHLFRDVIEAIKSEYDLPSRSIAIDTTSGTKEMSIIGAVATIDSHIAFTYIDTDDGFRARRFDARAIAVGISE